MAQNAAKLNHASVFNVRYRQMKFGRSANGGFTLVELVIVLAVMAILFAIALPAFTDFTNSTRRTSAITLLVGDLNQARAEAIKRNRRALVCVRNAGGTACGTGTDWQNGWLVCADDNSDNDCAAADIINMRPALDSRLTLVGSAAVMRFNASGSAVAGSLTLDGTWAGATPRIITVAATGRVSSQ